MKNEDKTKAELLKELKFLREEREKGVSKDITKLKQAEQAIQERENRFRELFKHMSSGVAIYEAKDNGRDFIIKDFNRAAEKIEKVKKEDILGKSVLKVFPGIKDFGLFKPFQEVYKTGKPQHHPISFYQDQRITGWRENYVYKLPSGEIVAVYDDITGRKKAEEQIKNSEERLKILFDYAPDAYYVSDLKGNFVDGNIAAERLVGYKKEELIGKNFFKLKLLSLADMPKAVKLLAKNLRRIPTGPDEFVLNRKDNSKVIVEISTYPVKIKGKALTLGIARDITERKKAEEETRQKTEDLVLINALNKAVNQGDNLLEILQLLARETKRIFSCHGATVYLLSEDREYLVMQILNRPPAMIRRIEKLIGMKIPAISIPLKAGSLYRKALQEGKPQLINDSETIQGLMAEFTENKILKKLVPKIYQILDTRSVINVPLVSKGKAIGLLDVSHKEPFTELDLKRFKAISGQLTSILERKQAEEKSKHLNLVLRAIRGVNQLIVREKDRKKLLKGVCENLIKTRGYYNAWIVLFDEKGKLETYAEDGLGKVFLPMVELLKRGKLTTCSQKALKQQEIVITENPASTCPECPLAQQYFGRGAMTIRLEHSGKVYGLMAVSIPAHLAVDQEEQSLFKEVAGDIAFSIYNIELDEERKQAEQELSKERTLLKAIIDKIPVLLTRYDPDTNMLYLNKEFEKIVGWKTEEVKDIDLMEKVYPDPDYRKQAIEYMQKASTEWREFQIQSKSGKIINSEWSNIRLDDGTQVGIGIDITERKQAEERLKRTMDATIKTVSKIVEVKDPYTAGHQLRVSQLTTAIAKELNLSQDKIKGIRIASLIHDIGKMSVPTEILSKSIALSDIEFSLIKEHSQIGYDILKSINFSYPVAQIVLQHHEKINGSGYPNKLKGDEILLEAKIICVADVVEAMSSHRPYRPALGIDAALEEISKNRGILYDPEIVDACIKLFKEKGFKFKIIA